MFCMVLLVIFISELLLLLNGSDIELMVLMLMFVEVGFFFSV